MNISRWVASLLLFAAGSALAQDASPACALLTLEEVKKLAGDASPGKGSSIVVTKGTYQGETIHSCAWALGTRGALNLSLTRGPKNEAEREAFRKLMQQTSERFQAKGWTLDRKPVGDARCMTGTPPATETNMGSMAGCFAEAKGKGISVGTLAKGPPVDMAAIKALLDEAIARLP